MNFRRVGASFGVSRPFVVDRNSCHFLWYGVVAGEGLRSVGAASPSKSVCSILPLARHLRAGESSVGHSPGPRLAATVLGRAFITPLLAWLRFSYPTSSVSLRFAPLKRCAGAFVVRPCLPPVGRAHSFPKALLPLIPCSVHR